MPEGLYPRYQDGSADGIRAAAATPGRVRLHALSAYVAMANYAAVIAASLGSASVSAGDITSATSAGHVREHTLASKSITLAAGHANATVHWALVDSATSEVFAVKSGAVPPGDLPLQAGGVLSAPSFVFASHPQP